MEIIAVLIMTYVIVSKNSWCLLALKIMKKSHTNFNHLGNHKKNTNFPLDLMPNWVKKSVCFLMKVSCDIAIAVSINHASHF